MRLAVLLGILIAASACATDTPEGLPSADASADARTDVVTASDMSRPDAGVDVGLDSGDDASIDMAAEFGGDANVSDGPPVRTIDSQCPMEPVEPGTDWTGWANLQFPELLELQVGEVSEPIFGQTWQDGVTDQPGMASGWEGQLIVGPLGVNPVDEPGCFRALDAEFNVDAGNNDEWWVRIQPDRAGLYAMYFRFRPPGGAWRYGDLNGSDDGVSVFDAAILAVDDPAGVDEVRAVTLNLRCRTEQWDQRLPLVVDGLVNADPHLVALQEDCSVPGALPQSAEVVAALAHRLDRGFQARREITHPATHPEGTFDEGVTLLSALPTQLYASSDLPYANFPRKAQVANVRLGDGTMVRVINTHFDFGAGNDAIRTDEATAVLGEVGVGPTLLLGDLNADPGDPAYAALDAELDDVWSIVGAGDGFTIPADAPTRRIDYIWFNGLTPRTATIVDESSGGVYLSDHVGVLATFEP